MQSYAERFAYLKLAQSLGYRLSQAGHKVHLIEAAPQIGGLSTWFDYGDFVWDKYYHVILKSDHHLLGLIDELGLSEQLHWANTKTGFLWNSQLYSMSNHLEFLRFPALNFLEKVRLGLGILYIHYRVDLRNLDGITAVEWLVNIFGKRVYQAIWEPLVASKFGVLKDQVPASILCSTIKRYYSTRSSGDGKEWMGHLRGHGLKSLLEDLAGRIVEKEGVVSCDKRVGQVAVASSGVEVDCEGETFTFDRLISTIPTGQLQKLFHNISGQDSRQHQFLGVIRLALVLKRPLSPYYVTNLIDRGFPFTGIIDVTRITNSEELGGKQLVMIPRYDVPHSEWFEKSDREIERTIIHSLKNTWSDLEENTLKTFVHRERHVQTLWIDPPPNEQKPMVNGPIWNVNAELAGRDTLNNNAIVNVANRAAKRFLESSA